ncbi:MAG: hypothetical protein QXR27_00050 [Archaeoglobaceae archaeon]
MDAITIVFSTELRRDFERIRILNDYAHKLDLKTETLVNSTTCYVTFSATSQGLLKE